MCSAYDDVIPILSPAVYCGFGMWFSKTPLVAVLFDGYIKAYSSCGFQQGDNIGITSSTCRHCTLSNSIMCSYSYSIPILSLFFFFLFKSSLLFNSKKFFKFLVILVSSTMLTSSIHSAVSIFQLSTKLLDKS